MNHEKKLRLAGFLAGLFGLLAGLALARGGFYLSKHEGDTLHLLQIVLRMAAGDWPHLDFVTPIGIFAFLPMALLVQAGLGIGSAIVGAQALVALLLLPAIWYVGWSRFSGIWAYLFGALVLVLLLALVHGETIAAVSISMHYNRWAWAVAFVVIAAAVLPAGPGHAPWADALVIGAGMAVLALLKVTYFVGFAPAVLLALLMGGQGRVLLGAVGAGLAVAGLVTLAAGPGFWPAYLADLLQVRGSAIRPQPGQSLGAVVAAPAYLAGSAIAVAGLVFLRQSGREAESRVLLLLLPGFFYVTFQNFANDPQWLALLGLLLWQWQPAAATVNRRGWPMRAALRSCALGALLLSVPSFANMAWSPLRQLLRPAEGYVALLPGSGANEDLRIARARLGQMDALVPLDRPGSAFAAFTDPGARRSMQVTFQEEELPLCSVQTGVVAWFQAIAADLEASGLVAGKTVFAADLLSSYWLFGDIQPLPGAAPWYYGGLPGYEAADFLLVPLCPMSPFIRRIILDEISALGEELREVRRNEMYVLYQR